MRHGTSKSYTRKPCHGCGESINRQLDKLCGTCQSELSRARAIIADTAGEMQIYWMPERPHALAYIQHVVNKHCPNGAPADDRFQEMILMLAKSLAIRVIDNDRWDEKIQSVFESLNRDSRSGGSYRVYMNPAQRDLLNEAYKMVMNIANAAYDYGIERGQNIIGQLANGQLSIEDFNKSQTERAQKMQAPAPNK